MELEVKQMQRELQHTQLKLYQLLQVMVAATVGSDKERAVANDHLIDLASDPPIARRILGALEQHDGFMSRFPELYWTAQLTLKGEKHVQMMQAQVA